MKIRQLFNSAIAICILIVAGNQFLEAGSLEPPNGTVAPTMASLQQIYDQQRFAAFTGGNVKAGPGLITSVDSTGTGTLLSYIKSCASDGSCTAGTWVFTIQNLGGCDVKIEATTANGAVKTDATIPAGQSWASSRVVDYMGTAASGGRPITTYTFLGGNDCQFMWVIR